MEPGVLPTRRCGARTRLRLTLLSLCALLAGCGSSHPTAPDPIVTTPFMNANINGARWTASRALFSQRFALAIVIGADEARGSLLSIMIDGATVGTHHVTSDEDARVFALYSESGPAGPAWSAGPFSPATGSVTITRASEHELAGTFEFVLSPRGSGAVGQKSITEGQFAVAR